MHDIVFTPAAENDIEDILDFTRVQFGELQTNRYLELIRQAVDEIAENPFCLRSKSWPLLHPQARVMHIARRGKGARHYILYRVSAINEVEIGRLLHDSVDLQRHLPEEYRHG